MPKVSLTHYSAIDGDQQGTQKENYNHKASIWWHFFSILPLKGTSDTGGVLYLSSFLFFFFFS